MKQRTITTILNRLLSAFVLSWLFMSATALSENVSIDLRVNGCEVSVVPLKGDGCDQDQCKGDMACVCVSSADDIEWSLKSADGTRLNNQDEFKLKFTDKSPLANSCGNDFKRSQNTCGMKSSVRVGQSFDYQIYLKRCRQGTDPRIIIKPR